MASLLPHLAHCTAMIVFIVFSMFVSGVFYWDPSKIPSAQFEDPWALYGWVFALVLFSCRYLTLLALPQAAANFLGLLIYNSFPQPPKLKVFQLFTA